MARTLQGGQGRVGRNNRRLQPRGGQKKQLLGSHQQRKLAEGVTCTTQRHQEKGHWSPKNNRRPSARGLLTLSQARSKRLVFLIEQSQEERRGSRALTLFQKLWGKADGKVPLLMSSAVSLGQIYSANALGIRAIVFGTSWSQSPKFENHLGWFTPVKPLAGDTIWCALYCSLCDTQCYHRTNSPHRGFLLVTARSIWIS